MVRKAVAQQCRAVPQPGYPGATAGMLLRGPGGSEGEELRHRSMEPPPAEIFRGMQLLKSGRRTEPPPEDPHQRRGREKLSAAYAEQYLCGSAPHAYRVFGK